MARSRRRKEAGNGFGFKTMGVGVALSLLWAGPASTVLGSGEPPVNDECPNAFDVGPLPATILGDTTDGTSDLFFTCGFLVDGPFQNVWYTVTGTGGTLTATTCSATTEIDDTEISVYCGDCDNQICVDGNDDDCLTANMALSTVSWCSEPGRTYFITVGGADSDVPTGLFELIVTDAGDVCEFPVNCEVITGACCSLGKCVETTTPDACDGEFYEGESCPDFVCPADCPCDDGLVCNGFETCDAFGDCVPGVPVDCSHLDDQCNEGVCDEDLDACVQMPLPDDTPCDDGLFCTTGDACGGGGCMGDPRDCSDGVVCTDDVCDEDADMCVSTPNDDNCNDGLFCNGEETCDPMLDCVPGTDVDCSHLDDVCIVGVCDEDADACVADTVADDEPCDDGLFCTAGETCVAGMCQGGMPRDCDDGVECTDDACDEDADACVSVPVDAACDDDNICTDDFCDPELGCINQNNGLCAACCDASPGLGGQCFDGVVASGCSAPLQTFFPGESCGDIFCAEVTGACCDGETGECTVSTQPECNCPMCEWTQDAACEEIECEPLFTPIPTVSEWGLAVLAILLMTGMKLRSARTGTHPVV